MLNIVSSPNHEIPPLDISRLIAEMDLIVLLNKMSRYVINPAAAAASAVSFLTFTADVDPVFKRT